jgi:quinol monooxygenase YgiN
MYAYIGKFTATPGNQRALADRLLIAAKKMENAAGCLQYLIYTGDNESVWVSEIWRTKDDHDASLEIPGVREFIRETMPLIANMDSNQLTPVGGHGPTPLDNSHSEPPAAKGAG